MPRPWRIRYAGAKYHVTVRGNGRRDVFHGADDYERFLAQLDDALENDGVVLYAYALLSNHYHLYIETPYGNVQRFMQRLNTAYSMYHRYKHNEPGHCFQGRYGAKLISGDAYITALTRYIHLNPVKTAANAERSQAALLNELSSYPWSSYHGYVDAKKAESRVDYRWLSLMGCATRRGNAGRYRRYVEGFLDRIDEPFRTAMTASRYAIGDRKFVEQVAEDLREVEVNKGVYGDIVWPEGKQLAPETVVRIVAKEFNLDPDELATRSYAARIAKKVALELCCRYTRESQRAVGRHFGYHGNGSVAKQRQRLREVLTSDRALQRRCKRIEKALASA